MSLSPSQRLELLDELADEFVRRWRGGERPPIEVYIARHPELAGDIRELFPALLALENAGDSLKIVAVYSNNEITDQQAAFFGRRVQGNFDKAKGGVCLGSRWREVEIFGGKTDADPYGSAVLSERYRDGQKTDQSERLSKADIHEATRS